VKKANTEYNAKKFQHGHDFLHVTELSDILFQQFHKYTKIRYLCFFCSNAKFI